MIILLQPRLINFLLLMRSVRLLQASEQLRFHLRQQHAVDPRRRQFIVGPGLQHVGQRRVGALLRLQFVQGRRRCHAEEGLEAHRHRQHRLPRLHRHCLLRRLLRLQEQPQGQSQPWRVQQAGRIRLIDRSQHRFDPAIVTS